jgi:Na+-translocating ferredoxin:NAD+ oxidoreductase RnfG subunit
MNVAQAQELMFPGVELTAQTRSLGEAQAAAIERTSGVRVRDRKLRAWRATDGGWFLLDEVLGKHEFITYALALDSAGAVRQIEVLEYRETYGGEVRNAKWREQFNGKRDGAPLKLDQDIRNISGATLSCRHIADGVRRLLATHAVVLAHD